MLVFFEVTDLVNHGIPCWWVENNLHLGQAFTGSLGDTNIAEQIYIGNPNNEAHSFTIVLCGGTRDGVCLFFSSQAIVGMVLY